MDRRTRDQEKQDQPTHEPAPAGSRRSLRVAPARGKVVPFQPRRSGSRRVPPPPPRRRFNLNWVWVGLVVLALVLPYIWRL